LCLLLYGVMQWRFEQLQVSFDDVNEYTIKVQLLFD